MLRPSSSSVVPDEESAEATLPLTSPSTSRAASIQISQRSLSFGSVGLRPSSSSLLDDPPPSSFESPVAPSWRSLLPEQLAVLAFNVLAWNLSRLFVYTENEPAPYQVTTAGDVLLDLQLSRPLVDPPTIPDALLLWTTLAAPLALVVVLSLLSTRSNVARRRHLLQAGICGFVAAVGLSEGTTRLLKRYVRRRRPNFYALCGFDIALKACAGRPGYIRDAHSSFPSGHSSLAACGATYHALFLLGRFVVAASHASRSKSNGGPPVTPTFRLLVLWSCLLLPLGWATFVGASRLADGWHHPSDVLAGWTIGGLSALIAYHAWFPPLWVSPHPWSLWRPRESSIGASGEGTADSATKALSFAE